MLTGVHFLLSYACTYECEHCFVHSSPRAGGTFTVTQVRQALRQLPEVGTIKRVYFEGGEPFLFYPVMLEGVRLARRLGFSVGIVTNAYWANSGADARLWLRPLKRLGIADLSLSDDAFHGSEPASSPPKIARAAAEGMGIPAAAISIGSPTTENPAGGGMMFKGRAADQITEGLPTRPWNDFTECPHEDFAEPKRVHLDSCGNVHVCQGVVIGNIWEKPLGQLLRDYTPRENPVIGPLLSGGPAELVRTHALTHEDGYVDACHLCYRTRQQLRGRFPNILAPEQVYGVAGTG